MTVRRVATRIALAMLAFSFVAGGEAWEWNLAVGDAITDKIESFAPATPAVGGVDVADVRRDVATIEHQMVQDVAEQCAIVIASGMDEECSIALTTPAEETALFDQILNAWND